MINGVQLTDNFFLYEFQSPDTKEVKVFMPLIEKLQAIRNVLKEPMLITSGYRTKEHNGKIPGAEINSAHLYGLAADIQIKSERYDLLMDMAKTLNIPRRIYYGPGVKSVRPFVHLGYNDIPK